VYPSYDFIDVLSQEEPVGAKVGSGT